jgi:hypothetical protein
MIVTQSNGLAVTPDWFGGTPMGSILHPGNRQFTLSLSSLSHGSLKIFISIFYLYRAFFTSKKYVQNPLQLESC